MQPAAAEPTLCFKTFPWHYARSIRILREAERAQAVADQRKFSQAAVPEVSPARARQQYRPYSARRVAGAGPTLCFPLSPSCCSSSSVCSSSCKLSPPSLCLSHTLLMTSFEKTVKLACKPKAAPPKSKVSPDFHPSIPHTGYRRSPRAVPRPHHRRYLVRRWRSTRRLQGLVPTLPRTERHRKHAVHAPWPLVISL